MAGPSAYWKQENGVQLSESEYRMIENCHSRCPEAPLQIGLPTTAFGSSRQVGQFLYWQPWNLPPGKSISISSSRLPQKLDEQSDWFDALRTIAVQLPKEPAFLITSPGTTTHDFVRRIAELFQIPVVDFTPLPDDPPEDWFKQVVSFADVAASQPQTESTHSRPRSSHLQSTVYYKLLDSAGNDPRPPNIDDLLVQSATTSYLLSVRKGGKIEHAAHQRLKRGERTTTRILINRRLTPKTVEKALRNEGATGWWLYGQSRKNSLALENAPDPNCFILSDGEFVEEDYLIHWTRRRVGPWPDQSPPEYLDDLIFQTGRRNHSELAALCRILASKRILASNELTRDRRPVVCFSDIPLSQILQQRVFRPHLSRWDFEPFGIAIDRELLKSIGARPVIYSADQNWAELPEDDRPFFQLEKSKSEKIDWRNEREWRLLGDLPLRLIPHDQAVVFVNTTTDVPWVESLSPWPVVVLSPES